MGITADEKTQIPASDYHWKNEKETETRRRGESNSAWTTVCLNGSAFTTVCLNGPTCTTVGLNSPACV